MPLHEKRFDPKGTLVVAKGDGLRFGGRTYNQGEPITDPTLTMRKARQLYFQNKLCYDYELADKAADREEAARSLALAREKIAAENAAREEQAKADAEAAARAAVEAEAARKAAYDRAVEQANIAAGRVPAVQESAETSTEGEQTPAPVNPAPEVATEAAIEPAVEAVEPAPELASLPVVEAATEDANAVVEASVPRRRRRAEAPSTDAAPPADTLVGGGIGALE
jgi:hypothetical protein